MGTRADFYVGRGTEAEWIGSIAWDGYPDGLPDPLLQSDNETGYRILVDEFFRRDHAGDHTRPDQGWPWPWDTSSTTDYAYAFDGGRVWASNFGGPWFDATTPRPEEDTGENAIFPDMAARQNVTRLAGLVQRSEREARTSASAQSSGERLVSLYAYQLGLLEGAIDGPFGLVDAVACHAGLCEVRS